MYYKELLVGILLLALGVVLFYVDGFVIFLIRCSLFLFSGRYLGIALRGTKHNDETDINE